MPIKVYLSQANQKHNVGPLDYTEKEGCAAIVKKLAAVFDADERFKVKCAPVGNLIDTADENIAEANEWDADYYVAVHTNAGEKGTITFHHSNSPKGKKLAQAIYKEVAPLSPGKEPSGRVRVMDGFKEIRGPRAPACLVELEAHDWKTGVEWITGEVADIAWALYRGICKGVGKTPKTRAKPKPARIALTARDVTMTRPIGVKAGWRNVGFSRYLKRVRKQGDGKRIIVGPHHITFPEPKKKGWWWDDMLEWRGEHPIVLVKPKKRPFNWLRMHR